MLGNFEIKRPDLNRTAKALTFADYSSITDLFLCVPAFQFNTLADFTNESVWLATIANEYVFPIHKIIDVQNQSEDATIVESKFNFRHITKPGKYRFAFSLNADIDYFIDIKKYEGQNLKAYFADINGNLLGVKDGSTVKPFDLDSILVKKIGFGDPNQASLTTILIDCHDPIQIESGHIIKPTWEANNLVNTECILSLEDLGSNHIRLTITDPCYDGVIGLISSNFTLTDSISGLISLSAFTEVGYGIYTATVNKTLYLGMVKMISNLYHATEYYDFGSVITFPQYNPTQYKNTQYKTA
jgi:hypothetical protein